jgi:hypothetical protein
MIHPTGGQHTTNQDYDASPLAKFQCDGLTHLRGVHQILIAKKKKKKDVNKELHLENL